MCGIFQCMKGINRAPGDPNYDLFRLALRSTAKRLYPNYANADVSMQKDWEKQDIEIRQKVLDSLTKEQQIVLCKQLKKEPKLQNILGVEVIE